MKLRAALPALSALSVFWAVCMLALPGKAMAWNAGNDEANRQRAMQRMRDDSARADRASADRAFRRQADVAAEASRSRSSAGAVAGNAASRSGLGYQGHANAPADAADMPRANHNPNAITVVVPNGVPPAVAMVMMEASAGIASAQTRLGRMLYAGYLVPRDDVQARRWFEAAARSGQAEAQGMFGYFLERGLGGAASAAEGERWLLSAADKGDPFAQMRYGLLQLVKNEGREGYDARTLLKYLQPAAEQGEWGAQAALAALYMGHMRVPADDGQRVRWLQAASLEGDADSMKDLAGYQLQGGGGLRADPALSLQWLRKAVALKHAGATRNLAGYYFNGLAGLTPSVPQGLELLKQAADLGDALAQGQYGMVLVQGQMLKPDLATGVGYISKSAQAGNDFGLDALARLHVEGLGVPRDLPRAVQLLRRSLEVGPQPPDPQTTALLDSPELQQAARSLDAARRQ